MFRLRVARSAAEIDSLRSIWESVHTPDLTLFQSFRWNRLAAQLFGNREIPYLIVAENDNGAAIIPAIVRSNAQEIGLAGEALFDYRDYLAQGDHEVLFRAWQHLVSLGLPISVTAICRPHAAIWDRLPKNLFSRSPRQSSKEMSSSTFSESHARAFSRFRKLERLGLELKTYRGDSPVVRHVYQRRARQSQPGELFHDPIRLEFMVTACRNEGPRCEVFTLEHGSTLAAALITFRDEGYRRFYTTYYDRAWSRYSPGVSLLFEIAKRSLEQGLSFDLMTGEQAYKKRIAAGVQDLFEVKATAAELLDSLTSLTAIEQAA